MSAASLTMDPTTPDLGSARLAATTLVPALAYARACAETVDQHHLTCPTPCENWDVGQVLGHMVQSLQSLTALLAHGTIPADEPGAPIERQATHLRAQLAVVATSLVTTASQWRNAPPAVINGAGISRHQIVHVAAIEAAVHGWDLASGTLTVAPLSDELASLLLSRLDDIVKDETRGGSFAPPVQATGQESPARRLLATLGRDPDWRSGHD
jgi:uncharacterized protein (TIGR03086 family)